jgi:hypothetical protein
MIDWLTLTADCAAMAQRTGIPMAIGWQQNDDTGQDEPGYCPLYAVGPCFVHTPLAVVRP